MKGMLPGTFGSRLLRSLLAFLLLIAIAAPARAQLSMNVGPSLGTTPLGHFHYGLVASGGTGAYTWEVIGSLPPGLALRTDYLPPWFPPGSTAGIVGIATTAGDYAFTVRVTSGGDVLDQPTTLRVTALTARDGWEVPPAVKGAAYSYQLELLNAAGPGTWSAGPGTVPAGLTLSPTGLLSGTPTVTGTFDIPYTVSAGGDTIGRSLRIDIRALAVTNAYLPTVTSGVAYSTTLTVAGAAPPFTFSLNGATLPPGLSLDGATGVISGTVVGYIGRYGFGVNVTDGDGNNVWKNLTLLISSPPQRAPIFRPYGGRFQDCIVGSACTLGIEVENGEAPFTWSAGGLPPGMVVMEAADGRPGWLNMPDGAVWGTPTQTGDYQVTVTATDANGASTTNVFPLHVSGLAIVNDPFSATLGAPIAVAIKVIGGSGPYTIQDAPEFGGNNRLPEGMSLVDGTITGTPMESGWFNPFFLVTESGGDTLFVNWGFGVNTAGLSINSHTNLWTHHPGSSYSQQLFACCLASNDYAWTVVRGPLPPGLTLTAQGLLSGTLTTEGNYTFVIGVADAADPANRAAAQFSMMVTSLGITGNWTLPAGNVGAPYTHTFTASGGSGPVRFRVQSGWTLPPGLSLDPVTGVLSGTPLYPGAHHFGIQVESGGAINFANLYLSIYPAGVTPPVWPSQGPLFGPYSFGPIDIPLFATGGNGTYDWSITAGTTPPGLALRKPPLPMAPGYNPTPQAEFAGIPTSAGTFNFTFHLESGGAAGALFDQAATVRVSPVHSTDNWALRHAFTNRPYTYTLGIAGCSGDVTFAPNGLVPPGLSLSAGGVLSGTPTDDGWFDVGFTVVCSDSPGERLFFTRHLEVFDIFIETPGELPNATLNGSYAATISASGGVPPYKFTASSLPRGLYLDPDSGEITGAASGGAGPFNFHVTATDSREFSYTKAMSIDVVSVPATLPNIGIGGETWNDCTFGMFCPLAVYVANGGVAPFTWTVAGLPDGLHARFGEAADDWVGPTSVEIHGVPLEVGPAFPITITLRDAEGRTTTNTFPLGISPMWIQDFWGHAIRDEYYEDQLRIIGGVPPYTTEILSGKVPAGLSYDPARALLSGTPRENGSFRFRILVTDAIGQTLRTSVNVEIGGGTTTVTINSFDLWRVTAGQSSTRRLSACCSGYGFTWQFEGTHPDWIALAADGTLTSSAPAGTSGTFTFFVRAYDAAPGSTNYGQREVTVAVNSVPFYISGDWSLPFANVGTPYSHALAYTGGSGAVTWELSSGSYLPPGLSLAAGVLSGTPTSTGSYRFTLTARDAAGNVASANFTLPIYPAGEYPPLRCNMNSSATASLGTWTWSIDQTSATGGRPPYSFSITPDAPEIPGVRLQSGPPYPTWINGSPTAMLMGVLAETGEFTTSLRVTDSAGNHADQPFTLTVPPMTILSNWSPPAATVGVPYFFQLEAYPSGTYTWSARTLPDGLTVDPVSGLIAGTPTAAGSFYFDVTLTDPAGPISVGRGFTLVINPFAITTSAVLPRATQGIPYSVPLAAPGCGEPCSWSVVSGGPSWLTLSAAGLLAGTPGGQSWSMMTVRVTGSAGQVTKRFTLFTTGTTPPPLAISTSTLGDLGIGNDAGSQIYPSGGKAPFQWTVDSGSLPPGIMLTDEADTLSSNYSAGFAYLAGRAMAPGIHSFTLRVTDADGTTATRAYTWNVSRLSFQYGNLPLVNTALRYNEPYTQPLLALGGSGSYTFTALSPLPPGLTLNSSTGVVSGTPANTGNFGIQVRTNDTAGNSITTGLNFAIAGPTGVVLSFGSGPNLGTVQVGSPATFNMGVSGGTAPYTLTALDALPPGMSLVSQADGILGATANAFSLIGVATTSGTFTFTMRAEDYAGNIGVRTFTLAVSPLALTSGATLPDASVGVPFSVPLLAFSPGASVTWALAQGSALPPGLTLSAAGVMEGTPSLAGQYSFSLVVSDGTFTMTRTFSLRVSSLAITDPVTALLPRQTAGTAYTVTFAAAGGAPVVWSMTGNVPGLSLNTNTGVLSGTLGNRGLYGFTVTATVGTVSVSRRFTLPVGAAGPLLLSVDPNDANLGSVTLGQGFSYVLFAEEGVPPYTWDVAPGSALPPGTTIVTGAALHNSAPGTTALAGVASAAGTHEFDLVATDAVGNSVRRTFRLHVSPIGLFNTSFPVASTGVPYSVQLFAAGGTGSYTFSALEWGVPYQDLLPPGLTLSNGGFVSGTPTSSGTYTFMLHVADGAGNTFERVVTINVNGPGNWRITNSNPTGYWVGSGRSLRLTNNGPGNTTYTWSVAPGSDSLPPGLSFATGLSTSYPTSTWIVGAPSAAGTFQVTVRATDNAAGGSYADHLFTFHVGEIQLVVPPIDIINIVDVPAAQQGVPYSFTFKAAGGTPPYSFTQSPFTPLPPGMTLSADGVLSGTPQASGIFYPYPIITDSAGRVADSYGFNLFVAPAGKPLPLSMIYTNIGIPPASLGVPYGYGLDVTVRGGTAPLSWSVAPGTTLPPGLALVTDGTKTYLAGTPTASSAMPYKFAFLVTDAATPPQTLTVSAAMRVAPLALTPDALPAGRVGTPYSQTLTASGGVAPYTISLATTSGLPPGLTFSGGSLAGTPTHAGTFSVFVGVRDAGGVTLPGKWYVLTIDNAAGEAPAIAVSPRPIQVYYEVGNPNPVIPLSITSTSGAVPFTIGQAGIPGMSLSAAAGTTPRSVTLTIDAASLALGTYTGVVGVEALTAANLWDYVPVTVTVAPPPPCTYSITPPVSTIAEGGGSATFTVSTGPTCRWTPSTAAGWLTVVNPTERIGTGDVTVTAPVNGAPAARTGTVQVDGAVHSVTQFGTACSFAISPATVSATAAAWTVTVHVTASDTTCGWNSSSSDMAIALPGTGTGDGDVTLTIPMNVVPAPRTLTATIAGRTFTVNQSGADCTVALSPAGVTVPAEPEDPAHVQITTPAGCSYDTVVGASWLHVTSGGSGNGPDTVVFTADPNSTTLPRTGTLTIGGQVFQVTQEALACSVTIGTGALGSPYGSTGGAGTIAITANGANCSWTASSDVAWATLSRLSGSGNGSLNVVVASNAGSTSARSGVLTIAGQTVNITQSGTACSYALESTTGAAPASGGNGSVRVIAPSVCGWSSTSNAAWLTITSSGSQGSSSVQFSAAPNASPTPRSGTLTIAGLAYTVTQAAAACTYTITGAATSPLLAAEGASESFTFTSSFPGCSPSAVSYASWLTVDSVSFAGTEGTVTYTAAENTFGISRSGTLQVGNATFTAVQAGAPCSYGLNYWGKVFRAGGGSSAILGSPTAVDCAPVVGTDQPSFIALDPLSGPVANLFTLPYTVAPYPATLTGGIRYGTITFGGQIVVIKQYSW